MIKSVLKKLIPAKMRTAMRRETNGFVERTPLAKSLFRLKGIGSQNPRFLEGEERAQFLRKAFMAQSFNGIAGDYAEFGCNGCGTFANAYRQNVATESGRILWAFDSFQGLPPQTLTEDEHPRWVEGEMATSLAEFHKIAAAKGLPESAYRTVPGFYDDTIGPRSTNEGSRPTSIAIAYVDCDLYTSTVPVLAFLTDRIGHGTIIAFDDYFCYSAGQISGERKAFLEWQKTVPQFSFLPYLPYLPIGWHGMSFIVESNHSGI